LIDLHCHLLPGIDDGALDLDASIAMARAAVEGGVEAIVATPHVSGTYRNDPATFADRCAQVQVALDAVGVALRVHSGAEVSVTAFQELDDVAIAQCAIGGRYILLEPPYNGPAPFLDRIVFDLSVRGYGVVLAHPERIAAFQSDVAFLEKLVGQGALCSVTAASVSGQWGRAVKRFTEELFHRGLVHNLASDAHDPTHRSPALRPILDAAVADLPQLESCLEWLTVDVPAAVVAGRPVQGEPPRLEPPRGLLSRLRKRL
jgi:protein-tyrosine phosphatase